MASAVIQRRDRLEEAATPPWSRRSSRGSSSACSRSPPLPCWRSSSTTPVTALAAACRASLRTAGSVPDALLQRRFSFLRRLVIEPAQVSLRDRRGDRRSSDMGSWSLVIGQYAGVVDAILAWVLVRWWPNPRLASLGMWRELVGYGRHILVATAVLNAAGKRPPSSDAFGIRAGPVPLRVAAGVDAVSAPARRRGLRPVPRLLADRHRSRPAAAAFLRSLRWACLALPTGAICPARHPAGGDRLRRGLARGGRGAGRDVPVIRPAPCSRRWSRRRSRPSASPASWSACTPSRR